MYVYAVLTNICKYSGSEQTRSHDDYKPAR